MKERIFRVLLCFVLLAALFTLAACTSEADTLRAQIEALEGEKAELQSTVSTLQTDLQRTQTDLSRTQNELQNAQAAAAAAEEQAAQQGDQSGPLAITYGGEPNKDMSWPLNYGELVLGLRVNLNDIDDEDEIFWYSEDESIFTVIPGEDGMTATVFPETIGSAQLVVTIGDQETKSWVRIT